MADLHIPLKGEYFDQIRAGTKPFEYRLRTPYWAKRLVGRTYDNVVFTRGYPKKTDTARRHVEPWRGYIEETINHPHFGPDNVEVFSIRSGPDFTCATCGRETELAAQDPSETVCALCCEDHEYERNTDAGWPTCIHCNVFAPDDYLDEQPGDE